MSEKEISEKEIAEILEKHLGIERKPDPTIGLYFLITPDVMRKAFRTPWEEFREGSPLRKLLEGTWTFP